MWNGNVSLSLCWAMPSKPIPVPKPAPRLTDRVQYKREREQQARDFRMKVWARDKGRCVVCRRVVKRTLGLDPLRGEVHHVKARNVAPELRYEVSNGVLVCLADHIKLTRHEITIPKERMPT